MSMYKAPEIFTVSWRNPAILPGLLFLAAILAGAALRITLTLTSDFPNNDGGMLAVMVEDLLANNFRLPAYTTYNAPGNPPAQAIPFAYPPLPFYLAAVLVQAFDLSLIELQRWLPVIFSIAAILAFYWLAQELLQNRYQAAFASLVYAIALPSFDRLLMGGGLTRAPGTLFSLLALAAIQRVFTGRRKWRDLALATCLAALTILSHPVYAWLLAYSAAILWIFSGARKENLPSAAWIAAGALVLTAPWWLWLLNTHGLAPVLSAFNTRSGSGLLVALGSLLVFDLTRENFLDVLGALALLGLLQAFVQRRWLFPAWLLAIFLFERTTPVSFAILPLAMLAANGAALVAWALLYHPDTRPAAKKILLIATALLLLYSLLSSQIAFQPARLSASDRTAMAWAAAHTSVDNRFAILTGLKWWNDPVLEWFPALSDRFSPLTVQGREWEAGERFQDIVQDYNDLQKCYYQSQPACLEYWQLHARGEPATGRFSHLYISDAGSAEVAPLITALRASPDYQIVYDDPQVVILAIKR